MASLPPPPAPWIPRAGGPFRRGLVALWYAGRDRSGLSVPNLIAPGDYMGFGSPRGNQDRVTTEDGPGLYFDGGADHGFTGSSGNVRGAGGAKSSSIWLRAILRAPYASDFAGFMGQFSGAGGWRLIQVNTFGRPQNTVEWNLYDGSDHQINFQFPTADCGRPWTLIATHDGTTARLDGFLPSGHYVASQPYTGPLPGAGIPLEWGVTDDRYLPMTFLSSGIWRDRALSPAHMTALHADPFAPIRPAGRVPVAALARSAAPRPGATMAASTHSRRRRSGP